MHEGHLVEEVNISELHKRNRKYIQFDLSDSEIALSLIHILEDDFEEDFDFYMDEETDIE